MVPLAKRFTHSPIWGYARGYLALVTVWGGGGAMREMGLCAGLYSTLWGCATISACVTIFSTTGLEGVPPFPRVPLFPKIR